LSSRRRNEFDTWEREAWRPPPEETIDVWAERSLVFPRIVSSVPGPLNLDLIPYIREPLRRATDSDVEEITLCCSTQVMKTTYLIIVALHTIAEDPWNILHVMSTEDDAEELCIERYAPIIHASPQLAGLLDGTKHQLTREAIRLNGCVLTFRGAHSPSGLASRPVAKLFLDEVDKWPEWSGKEADPIRLARERTRTFWNRKIISASTPTTANRYIWTQLAQSTDERYWVPCPHCGAFQKLIMGGRGDGAGIKWPDDATPEEIQKEQLASYRCENCAEAIGDRHKPEMLLRGKWVSESCRVTRSGEMIGRPPLPRHVGYHIWAAYSPWLTFSEIAGEFLRSKRHQSSLMNFRNSWQAEPWEITVNELRSDVVRRTVEEYASGEIDAKAFALTCGVDVQRTGSAVYQYYSIRAWGPEGESWCVRVGRTEGWAQLYQVLVQSAYRDRDGRPIGFDAILIDSGFETDEVYQICEMYGFWAAKGDSRGSRPYTLSETETSKGSGHYLRRVNVNVDVYKGQLHRLIRSGSWHLPRDLPGEYFEHLVAEQVVSQVQKATGRTRYVWKVIADGRPNHYLDCEVLNLTAADMLELRYRAGRPRAEPTQEEMRQQWEPVATIKERVFS